MKNRANPAHSSGPSWGQSFAYDGFGNLTSTNVIKGSAPSMAATYDANNHAGGEDANGNPGYVPVPAQGASVPGAYDVENRVVSLNIHSLMNYSYAPDNKRVWRGNNGNGTDEVTFWSISGRKMGTYNITQSGSTLYCTQSGVNLYFGGNRIRRDAWRATNRATQLVLTQQGHDQRDRSSEAVRSRRPASMKRRLRLLAPIPLVTLALASATLAQQGFPSFTAAPLLLTGTWERAEAAVVAEVQNIRPLGVQRSVRLSWPVAEGTYSVYWCQGDFHVISIISGRAPADGKKFVWGSLMPGCRTFPPSQLPEKRPVTRVWFVREEGDFVRPVVDYHPEFFYELHTAWNESTSPAPQIRFAQLLLTPGANAPTLSEFATRGFPEPANLACFILGAAECISRIKALATLGDANLRRTSCSYLNSQFGEACLP